jgi:hypothetical protein
MAVPSRAGLRASCSSRAARAVGHEVPAALFDADHHAFAVDIADLERGHLGGAQTRAIGHAQRRLVSEPWRCSGRWMSAPEG